MGILWELYGYPVVSLRRNEGKVLFFMCNKEELGGIEEVLPDDIRRGSEGREGVEVGLRHPNAEGGVFLSESLSGGDRGDLVHVFRCGSRVDEDILVVLALTRSRQPVANQFAETELEKADKEGGN